MLAVTHAEHMLAGASLEMPCGDQYQCCLLTQVQGLDLVVQLAPAPLCFRPLDWPTCMQQAGPAMQCCMAGLSRLLDPMSSAATAIANGIFETSCERTLSLRQAS